MKVTRKLELPKTMLRVQGRELTKFANPEAVVGRFPLDRIADVRLERHIEYLGAILAVTFTALAAVAKVYVPTPGWAWAGAIVSMAAALICSLTVSGRKIIIETRDGAVGYVVADAFEEAEGFVVTLRQLLQSGGKLEDADESDLEMR